MNIPPIGTAATIPVDQIKGFAYGKCFSLPGWIARLTRCYGVVILMGRTHKP